MQKGDSVLWCTKIGRQGNKSEGKARRGSIVDAHIPELLRKTGHGGQQSSPEHSPAERSMYVALKGGGVGEKSSIKGVRVDEGLVSESQPCGSDDHDMSSMPSQ